MDAKASMETEVSFCRRLDFDKIDQITNDEVSTPPVLNVIKDINKIHTLIPFELIPKMGMEFESEEDAYNFYLAYAKEVGFGIKRSSFHKDSNGKLMDRVFCCSAEGKRGKDKRDLNVRAPRPETRFNCSAKMKVNSRQTGKFRICQLIIEHNHYLSSPNKSHLHRSHRKINSIHAAEIDMAYRVGIAPKVSHELMALQVGGRENLGFIPEDYKNYLCSKRTIQMEVGDTGGVLEYLQKMQLEDPNFFYAIQVDQDALITNIFWADGLMRVDYASFGDVVCFDTTYRKNNEGRPFALFVGVNNHKQTAIFGAALLYDETTSTFEWLFDTFARAMSGKKPNTILTDQDAAMAKGLISTWPETRHRLCIWHIFQNAAIHLSHVFEKFKQFANDFSRCVYDFDEEEDFIYEWNSMLKKYGLEDNDWLKRIFEIREKWALVYGRETFCADMTTTQRSESMNSVIKRYVTYKNKFHEFFNHFERLVDDRRYKELQANFRAYMSTPVLPFDVDVLKQAASVYTPEVFKWFEVEWGKSHDCGIITYSEVGTVTEYKITPKGRKNYHMVRFDAIGDQISCSCRKFEFSGILCSHSLKVLNVRNIMKIPSQYIIKRWTSKAKAGYITDNDSCNINNDLDPKVLFTKRYRDLCRLYTQLVTKAAQAEETYRIAKEGLLKMLDLVDARLHQEGLSNEMSNATKGSSPTNNTTNASGINIKGIKKKTKTISGKRLRSSLEKATKRRRSTKKSLQNSVTMKLSASSHDEPVGDIINIVSTGCSIQHHGLQEANTNEVSMIESLQYQQNYGQLCTFSSMNMTGLLKAQELHGFGGAKINQFELNDNSYTMGQKVGADCNEEVCRSHR
ncbi:protein FAR1-RELATED SEQUENCE 5-like [Coffea arabica]|uniref:Protein FAR1-RELATED SEQUENCE n=1 Tax=Coffea arabica TaxID=13443 RepID=A0A6P6SPN8_COFAR|nr:protein FAR1-RELATED SEQUENCE 5-like [Coffea arabica]